jgi:DNA-binding transcriptional MerR regulator
MTKSAESGLAGETGLISIGELARSAGTSIRTIRYYEQLGILPEPRRTAAGTRKYPREYGGYIAATLALKELGFRLDELKPLARIAAGRQVSPGQRDAAVRLVQAKLDELIRRIVTLRRLHESVSQPTAAMPVCAVLAPATGADNAGLAGDVSLR